MSTTESPTPLGSNKWFRRSLISTLVAVGACLSTHILALAGITVAVAWFDALEHALVVAAIAGVLLTLYAVYRHRKGCHLHTRKKTG